MANKYDLKIVQKTLTGTTSGTDLGIGVVAADKTRFVTFVKIYCPTGNTVQLGPASAATGALTSVSDKQGLTAGDTIAYPDKPDIENPLFSIAAGKYLGAITGAVADTELTLEYYDE